MKYVIITSILISIVNVQPGAIVPHVPGVQHPIFDEMDSKRGGSNSRQECVKVCDKKYAEKVKAGALLTGIELFTWALLIKSEYDKCVAGCPS